MIQLFLLLLLPSCLKVIGANFECNFECDFDFDVSMTLNFNFEFKFVGAVDVLNNSLFVNDFVPLL